MAESISDGKVHKSLVMDKELAGAIGIWAAAAGVGFSEEVRRLCAQALSEWPDAAGAIVEEVRRAEKRLSDELVHMSVRMSELDSRKAELLALLAGVADNVNDDYDDGYDSRISSFSYGEYDDEDDDDEEGDGEGGDVEPGGGFDAEEFDREFDEWWEGTQHEWE